MNLNPRSQDCCALYSSSISSADRFSLSRTGDNKSSCSFCFGFNNLALLYFVW
jgi:hypothetical protein